MFSRVCDFTTCAAVAALICIIVCQIPSEQRRIDINPEGKVSCLPGEQVNVTCCVTVIRDNISSCVASDNIALLVNGTQNSFVQLRELGINTTGEDGVKNISFYCEERFRDFNFSCIVGNIQSNNATVIVLDMATTESPTDPTTDPITTTEGSGKLLQPDYFTLVIVQSILILLCVAVK